MQGTGQPPPYYTLDIQEHQNTPPPTLRELCAPSACCLDAMATMLPGSVKIAGGFIMGAGFAVGSPIAISTGGGLIAAGLLANIIACARNVCTSDTICMEISSTIGAGVAGVISWAAWLGAVEES